MATLWQPCTKYSLCISIHWPLPTYEISSWYLKRIKSYRGGRTDRPPDRQTTRLLEIPAGSKNPGIFKKWWKSKNPQLTKDLFFIFANIFLFQKNKTKIAKSGILGIFFKKSWDFWKSRKSKNPQLTKLLLFFFR